MLSQELLHLLPVHGREVVLRDLELLLQVVHGVILVIEEAEHQLEVCPGMEGQEVQFLEQRQGPVPGTAEQVDQVHIHVVIHPEGGVSGSQAQGHRAAAAADLQQAGRPSGEQLENIGQQEELPAHPGEEGLSDPPHLPRTGGRPPWSPPDHGGNHLPGVCGEKVAGAVAADGDALHPQVVYHLPQFRLADAEHLFQLFAADGVFPAGAVLLQVMQKFFFFCSHDVLLRAALPKKGTKNRGRCPLRENGPCFIIDTSFAWAYDMLMPPIWGSAWRCCWKACTNSANPWPSARSGCSAREPHHCLQAASSADSSTHNKRSGGV